MVEIRVGVLGGAHLVDELPHGGGRRVLEEIGLIREAVAVERGIETNPLRPNRKSSKVRQAKLLTGSKTEMKTIPSVISLWPNRQPTRFSNR